MGASEFSTMASMPLLPNIIPDKFYIVFQTIKGNYLLRLYSDRTNIFLEHERKMELVKYLLSEKETVYLLWDKTSMVTEITGLKKYSILELGYTDLETGVWHETRELKQYVERGRVIPVCEIAGGYDFLYSVKGQTLWKAKPLDWCVNAFVRLVNDTRMLQEMGIFHNHYDFHYFWINDNGLFVSGLEEADVVTCDDLFDYPMHAKMLLHHTTRLDIYRKHGYPVTRHDLCSMGMGALFKMLWDFCMSKCTSGSDLTYFVHTFFSSVSCYFARRTMLGLLNLSLDKDSCKRLMKSICKRHDMAEFRQKLDAQPKYGGNLDSPMAKITSIFDGLDDIEPIMMDD